MQTPGSEARTRSEAGHSAETKRQLGQSWSSKRLTYPLPDDLRACVPYCSGGVEVTVCLCFMTHRIAFHLGQRIGRAGRAVLSGETQRVCGYPHIAGVNCQQVSPAAPHQCFADRHCIQSLAHVCKRVLMI